MPQRRITADDIARDFHELGKKLIKPKRDITLPSSHGEASGSELLPPGNEGDILYRDAVGWKKLPIGTTGQVLRVTEITPGHLQPRWGTLTITSNIVVGPDRVVVGGLGAVIASEEL